jgi:tetratricopeptide (TPR) repeat protein
MSIRGSLKEASLPDVLQLLAMGRKTGCLSVADRSEFGYVYFDHGRISYASIVNRRDRLGDLLVKAGAITPAQLDEAITQQSRNRTRRLGELLVEQGALAVERLHEIIRVQIEEAVYFLFTWTNGTFNFEPDVLPDDQDLTVSINPESLLLEGARRLDEWSQIEKKIPSLDLVFEIDRRKLFSTEAELTAAQRTILEYVDGVRDVRAIADASGLVEFEVGKALYGLLSAGFVHRIGKSTPAAPTNPTANVDEHRAAGVALYKTAMLDEAAREFRHVLSIDGSDLTARFYMGLLAARRDEWEEAVAAFTDAASHPQAGLAVFHNLAAAADRAGRSDEAQAAFERAAQLGGDTDARVQLSLAVHHLRRGNVADADAALTAARQRFTRQPTADWFHYAGLVAMQRADLNRAEAVLTEGTQMYPRAAVLHNNLAVVRERRGEFTSALVAAEAAVVESPGLAQAHRNVGDLYAAAGREQEAADAYTRAREIAPALGSELYVRLGDLQMRRGFTEDATRSWTRALEVDPDCAAARLRLESAGTAAAAGTRA